MTYFVSLTVAVCNPHEKNPLSNYKPYLNIYPFMFSGAFCLFCIGLVGGWISPNIQRWLSPESDIPMTETQSSWVVSFVVIGCMLSTIPSGFLINIIGRKNLLLASSPFLTISWLIVIYTRSIEMLYLARCFQGISFGLGATAIPIYLGEISEVNIRGLIGTFFPGLYFIGVLVGYIVGSVSSYDNVAYFNLLSSFIFFVMFYNMPKSPSYLVSRNKMTEARKSLKWLRGNKTDEEIEEEINSIVAFIEKSRKDKSRLIDLMSTYPARRGNLIILTLVFVEISGGSVVIATLASHIFTAAGHSFLSANGFTIVIGVVQVISFLVIAPSVDTFGRRFLVLWSILFCAICQIIVTIYFYVMDNTNIDVSGYSWVPPIFLALYLFFNGIGPTGMTAVLKNELFLVDLRGFVSAEALLIGVSLAFVSFMTYQWITITFGIYLNHAIFSVVCIFGLIVCYIMLPETKGLTLKEIQNRLENRN